MSMAFIPEEDAATIPPEQAAALVASGALSPNQPGLRFAPVGDEGGTDGGTGGGTGGGGTGGGGTGDTGTGTGGGGTGDTGTGDTGTGDTGTGDTGTGDTGTGDGDGGGAIPRAGREFDEDAFARLNSLLSRIGLQKLTPRIRELVAKGITDGEAILFELRGTEEYKSRFKANAARAAKGLPELDPATYVGLEQSFRDVLSSNNLPVDFYNDPDDFNAWIEGEVSPSELQARIRDGYAKVRDADPAVKDQMQRLYGVSDSELAAYFLDPKRAKPLFDAAVARRQAEAAQIAARGAELAGIQLTAGTAEDLARRGITPEEAQQRFARRAELAGLYQPLAGEEALSPERELGAVFGYDVAAQQALERRRAQRVGEFQAGGGFARTTGKTSGTVETGLGGPQ